MAWSGAIRKTLDTKTGKACNLGCRRPGVQERFVLICHAHAIGENAEGVDHRRTDDIGVAKSQRLRRVVITGPRSCQQILRLDRIGGNRLVAADQITRE